VPPESLRTFKVTEGMPDLRLTPGPLDVSQLGLGEVALFK
jgi:hypothetical protein